jgi:hypothetical protein
LECWIVGMLECWNVRTMEYCHAIESLIERIVSG